MSRKDKSSGVYGDLDKEMEKSSDERFLRLEEDGDRVSVFFAGTPYSRYVYWDGQQTREWSEGCGQKKTLRVTQNIVLCDIEDDKLEIIGVKVLEQGKRFYQNVSKRDKKYGIHNWVFEVERSGGKGDTDTTYDIDAEYELSDKEREKLMAMELFDLEELYAELAGDDDKKHHKPVKKEEPDEDDDISAEQRKELVELFKTLDDPEAEGKKFCKEFGIDKVRNLPKSRFKRALKYIDRLLAKSGNGDNDEDDDSPF